METPRSDPTVEALRGCSGDPARAAQLLDAYRDRLRTIVRFRLDSRLRARVDESDLVQEALVEALGKLDRYLDDPSVPLFVWLRLIAAEQVQRAYRHHLGAQKRDARLEVSIHRAAFPRSRSRDLAERLLDSGTSPSDAVAREEARGTLIELLERLSDRDREILELRHFERLTNQEVARVFEVGESTAASWYFRALKRLRAAVDAAGWTL